MTPHPLLHPTTLARALALVRVGSGALLAAMLTGQASAAPKDGRLDCMILPSQVVQLGVGQPGVLHDVMVERGDMVKRGQVLAQQKAGVERAALALARVRAEQQGDHDAAMGATELADRDLERALALNRDSFVSPNYVDRQRAEARVAQGRLAAARERVSQSQHEVDLAVAQLSQRTIRAPIDGVVVDRLAQPGEFVDQKPILRLAAIDPLRVDVLVPAMQFGRVTAGTAALVFPELLEPAPREAKVTQVDRVIDGASNTFRVRLELPNPGGTLPAGLRCQVALGLDNPASLAAVPPAKAPNGNAAFTGATAVNAGLPTSTGTSTSAATVRPVAAPQAPLAPMSLRTNLAAPSSGGAVAPGSEGATPATR